VSRIASAEATAVASEEVATVAATEATETAVAAETESTLASACHSFSPATLVLLADGSRRPIAEVKIGDRVRTTDTATGATVIRAVTALHRNHDRDLTDLVVRDSAGHVSVVHTTEHHRFWNDTTHNWTETINLQPGDRLHSADNHDVVTVADVQMLHADGWMYDLTVDDVHSYYVMAREHPVLVHNCSRALGKALGEPEFDGPAHAHHLVPENHPLATEARSILTTNGIGIDTAENGVWLSPTSHYTTYPNSYATWVNQNVVDEFAAGGASAVSDWLAALKSDLAGADTWLRGRFS
jgi:Pretoxin HINT domain/A nuclease family of the HNH/ENDO VII superfamily with conserved AHH